MAVSCLIGSPGWPQTLRVAENDLDLLILLPPSPSTGITGVDRHTQLGFIYLFFLITNFIFLSEWPVGIAFEPEQRCAHGV